MDVKEYRKLNKPGWVVGADWGCARKSYIERFDSDNIYNSLIDHAEAFDNFDTANQIALFVSKTSVCNTYKAIPIPDLPKKDKSDEIKEDLASVIGTIIDFPHNCLSRSDISTNLYNIISCIVEEKLKPK